MKTVGQILLSERKRKKWTLDDVHKFIKIHPKYLKALESGDYSVFSNQVHAKGFLKIYSEFLELDVEQMLAFWRREYSGDFEKNAKFSNNEVYSAKRISLPNFVFTPKNVLIAVITLLIVVFFSIMFYQYKSYSGDPTLAISSPQDNLIVDREILDVTGTTERDVEVYVNNQRLILNTDGSFSTSIKLNPGLNTLSFSATNSLGKSISIIKTVVYREEKSASKEPISTRDDKESTESTPIVTLDEEN